MSWASIEGHVGRYAVSEDGEVMSMNYAKSGLPGVLRQNVTRGYHSVELSAGKRYTVHRLVAAAFLGPRPHGMHINHINGNKSDNRAANLEYVTPSDNQKHACRIGLIDNKGECHSQHKLKESDVRKIRELLVLGLTQKEIAASYSVSPSMISHIKAGRFWSHTISTDAAGEIPTAQV